MTESEKRAVLLASVLRMTFHIELIKREPAYVSTIVNRELKQELKRAVEFNEKMIKRIYATLTNKQDAGANYMATNAEKLSSVASIFEMLKGCDEETCAMIETELSKQITVSYKDVA